jgi:hypothetical protein
MIFKKILKGTDLTFDINLEKTQYLPGEIVKGTLSIKTEKGSKARKLMLLAEGKESTTITVTESRGTDSIRDTTSKTYSEVNTFFSQDLSNLLQKSVINTILQDGCLEISPQNNVIAFDFTLPTEINLFSSYRGKHANITYTVKGTIDIAKKLDVNKQESFSVINPINRTVGYSSSHTSFDGNNESESINRDSFENHENVLSSPMTEPEEKDLDKGNYEARFEQIFGKKATPTASKNTSRHARPSGTGPSFDLETIFAKGREDFVKESSEAKIDLSDEGGRVSPYSPGHTVRGKVMLMSPRNKEQNRKKIRGMKITLNGIEHATAQGLQRVSTIEKYDKDIELVNEDAGNSYDNKAIPFDFVIPQGVSQSYSGKYSEYFWGLEARVNIAWSSDLYARTIIEII